MLIPSQAIAIVWQMRAQGAPKKAIREVLAKPLTERASSHELHGWFYLWKKKHEVA